nr:hypothetical protein CJLB15_00070 [Campylobacter phage CJLB-15]
MQRHLILRVKLIFMTGYLDLLEENDIDLSNNELVTITTSILNCFDLGL